MMKRREAGRGILCRRLDTAVIHIHGITMSLFTQRKLMMFSSTCIGLRSNHRHLRARILPNINDLGMHRSQEGRSGGMALPCLIGFVSSCSPLEYIIISSSWSVREDTKSSHKSPALGWRTLTSSYTPIAGVLVQLIIRTLRNNGLSSDSPRIITTPLAVS
jgi:hypothetical protein